MTAATKPRLMITGGAGFLALTWAKEMHREWDVTLVQNRRRIVPGFAQSVAAHIADPQLCADLINRLRPDLIVHTAGLTDVEMCEAEPGLAKGANTTLAGTVAAAAHAAGVPIVHISTDQLFDGTDALVPETYLPAPQNAYARTKADGEAAVLAACPDALVLRTNFFGWGPPHRPSFSDVILNGLRSGRALNLFEDVYYTPILAEDLVRLAHDLVEAGASGIINAAGPERLSKLDFGLRIAAAFGLDPSGIVPSALANRKDLATRPLDMSLSDAKLTDMLGRSALPLDHAFAKLAKDETDNPVKTLGKGMIPYGRHHLDEDDIKAVTDLMRSNGWLTQGPTVEAFEDAVKEYVGVRYAVAVSSGTAGLHIAALAAGLGEGDKMVTTAVTFVASGNAAIYAGARPIFCDIEDATGNLDPNEVLKAVEADPSIKAIMPVHFGGLSCDMKSLQAIASDHNLTIIEDAAHAFGGQHADGSKVGSCSHSDMTVLSFHPVKAIAMGEGGLVTTNDPELYRALLRLRSHGINKLDDTFRYPEDNGPWYYEMQQIGFNYRITDIQCALGLSQLKKIDRFIARRNALAQRYIEAFANLDHVRPAQVVDTQSSGHHLFVLRFDFEALGTTRPDLMVALQARGVGSQVHYIPVPRHPFYRDLGYTLDNLPNANTYYSQALSIPLFFDLTDDQQAHVIASIREVIGQP